MHSLKIEPAKRAAEPSRHDLCRPLRGLDLRLPVVPRLTPGAIAPSPAFAGSLPAAFTILPFTLGMTDERSLVVERT